MSFVCWATQVQYNDEQVVMTPERAMSMLLKCMQNIAVQDQGAAVVDCVLAVPAYFTDAERLAMLDAANIAGLNCLRLLNDSTAGAHKLRSSATRCTLPAQQLPGSRAETCHSCHWQPPSLTASTRRTCPLTRRRTLHSWTWEPWIRRSRSWGS